MELSTEQTLQTAQETIDQRIANLRAELSVLTRVKASIEDAGQPRPGPKGVSSAILDFVADNPNCRYQEVISGLTDYNRKSIQDSLSYMSRHGRLVRRGRQAHYRFSIPSLNEH